MIVPDDQLSLAIGKDGLNARLAARLTGWRVDIRSETEFAEEEAEMGYDDEEVAGRCAAILANGKRCPNASLPGSRYCGLPAHQALTDQEGDFVVPPEEGANGDAPAEEAAAAEERRRGRGRPVTGGAGSEEAAEAAAGGRIRRGGRRPRSPAERRGGGAAVEPLRQCVACRRSLPQRRAA